MKAISLPTQSVRTRKHSFLSWLTVQKFYNAMPMDITPCKDIHEAKMYTVALLAVVSVVFLPLLVVAWFMYNSAKKGGQA